MADSLSLSTVDRDLLREIVTRLDRIERKVDHMHEEFKKVLKRIDDATNAIAQRIDALAARLEGGLTQEEAVDIKAQFEAEADKLEGLGKDPNNPVPQ